jgi:hypothetical protein
MRVADEKGIALVMVLILMGILSTLAASLIFVSQTETWSSQNYRLMTEARYAAESGVHRAANYLMNTYIPPQPTGPDPLSAYTMTTSPVQLTSNGDAVQLRSDGSSNYPSSTVVAGFVAAAHGTLTGGTNLANYDATATLISMRQVNVFGSGTPATVQTWQIVGQGEVAGARSGRVDVSAILERQVMVMFNYAAFATDSGCGALSWSGGGATDSYDSTQVVAGVPAFSNSGGNVGTNGNLDENGGPTIIYGSLSTPRSGVGSCATGAVTALTLSGSSPPTQGLVELPQAVNYPTPTPPNPAPTGSFTVNNGNSETKASGNYGDIVVRGSLHLTAGTYNVNSLTLNAGGNLYIDSGPVILNVAGYSTAGDASSGDMASPIDFTGQSVTTNSNLNPAMFQILYAGTGNIKMAGGADTAGLLFAPNATVQNNSAGAQWFGAVIARRVTDAGHAVIHYDRHLQKEFMMVGPWMMDSFTWRRF